MKINHLSMSWAISRGSETYGYNICRLDDRDNGKRYKCMGGGYDMQGTVLADWLADVYQAELRAFFVANMDKLTKYGNTQRLIHPDYYGAFVRPDGSISLDGGCGLESIERIADAIGLEVQREYDRRPRSKQGLLGFYVVKKGE